MLLTLAAASAGRATEPEPLALIGYEASRGAVPGYLDDAACGTCHADIAASYAHVGMAQSFSHPARAGRMEAFGREYHHAPSDRYYRIDEADGALTFHRYQKAFDGEPMNAVTVPVSWVLGSGNKARNYLYQTEHGELFLLPLGWFSETAEWGMSPGFEARDHQGLHRLVQRRCMFCHNAYPEVDKGADLHWAAEVFPAELPEGTGCQRCHGPGARHVRRALSGEPAERIRRAIVNPGRLSGERQDSVCLQCHLLPHVAVVGARRFERPVYAFRPGELLSDFLVHVNAEEQGVAPEDRFEINHHGHRFLQSRCYQESRGAIACTSCHNPHQKPEPAAFRAEVGEVCAGCHGSIAGVHEGVGVSDGDDCVGCHMPQRRTGDVVLTTMTDHRIARGPFDAAALVAPREPAHNPIASVELLPFGDPPGGAAADAYLAIATLRSNRSEAAALRRLDAALASQQFSEPTPYLDKARGELRIGAFEAAEATARGLLRRDGSLAVAYSLLGVALLGQGDSAEAVRVLRRSVELRADPEAQFNLALALLAADDSEGAAAALDVAIELRPFMAIAWRYRGSLLAERGVIEEARPALERSLALDPGDTIAYRLLVELLRGQGEELAAERYLELGLRVGRDPESLETLVRPNAPWRQPSPS